MPAAAYGAARGPEQSQDEAEDQHDDADCPQNRDLYDETDDEQDQTENDHRNLPSSIRVSDYGRLLSGGAFKRFKGRRGDERRRDMDRVVLGGLVTPRRLYHLAGSRLPDRAMHNLGTYDGELAALRPGSRPELLVRRARRDPLPTHQNALGLLDHLPGVQGTLQLVG
jgi:hypothetical protein